MQGVIKGISGNTLLLELTDPVSFPIDEVVDIKITKHRAKRSLSANAYFHVLVGKLSEKLGISFTACKNMLITSYGQIEYLDDQPVIIKTNIPYELMSENELLHAKPIYVGDTDAFWYRIYRGTHSYNSVEMGKLIDQTIEECKVQGIETLTPDELMRLENYAKYSK